MHQAFLDAVGATGKSALVSAFGVNARSAILGAASLLHLSPELELWRPNVIVYDLPSWSPAISLIAMVAAFGLILREGMRIAPADRVRAMLLPMLIAIGIFGPLGWLHYYLVPMFLMIGLWRCIRTRFFIAICAGFAILTSYTLLLQIAHKVPYGNITSIWATLLLLLTVAVVAIRSAPRNFPNRPLHPEGS
jgi:hypothetical protein